MKTQSINSKEIEYFSKTVVAFLEQAPFFQEFHAQQFNLEQIEQQTTSRIFSKEQREVLVDGLKEQYTQWNLQVPENVAKLSEEHTYTITTGHQLCLMAGPLYVIYKILSIIKLTQQLNAQPGKAQYVPVFWMASEDHDFLEVNHVQLYNDRYAYGFGSEGLQEKKSDVALKQNLTGGSDQNSKLDSGQASEEQDGRMSIKEVDAKSGLGPVGEIIFDAQDLVAQIKTRLKDQAFSSVLNAIIDNSYGKTHANSIAFSRFLHELFKGYGLVLIDAHKKHFKTPFIPHLTQELNQSTTHHHLTKTNQLFKQHNLKTQITPREINVFYVHGPSRNRIIKTDHGYQVQNTDLTFTQQEILAHLKDYPQRFSPNVALRPLYQEHILPNVATILGPSELVYWLQLKTTFKAFDVPYPALFLRDSFLLYSAKDVQTLSTQGLELKDIFAPKDTLLNKAISSTPKNQSISSSTQKLKHLLAQHTQELAALEPSMQQMLLAEMQKIENTLERIEKKFVATQKKQQEVVLNRLLKIRSKYMPSDKPQERVQNFMPFFVQKGMGLFDELLERSDVMQVDVKLLEL